MILRCECGSETATGHTISEQGAARGEESIFRTKIETPVLNTVHFIHDEAHYPSCVGGTGKDLAISALLGHESGERKTTLALPL